MSGLGQNIEDLLNGIDIDGLRQLIGPDLEAALRLLSNSEDLPRTIRKSARRLMEHQPIALFSRPEVRGLCYNAMSSIKLEELADRIGIKDRPLTADYDPTQDESVLARYLGFFGIDLPAKDIASIEPDIEEVSPDFSLFPHQRVAANRVWDCIGGGNGRVVLHMPTGAGKTRTAMHTVCRFLNTFEPGIIVWLANSQELLDQAAEAFQKAWMNLGTRPTNLVRFWGAHEPDISELTDGVLIGGLQKLHACKSRDELGFLRLARKVKCVVVDEAHQSIAPTYRLVIDKLSNTGHMNACLGLTATPGRSWSDVAEDEELSNFFDNKKVTLKIDGYGNPVQYLIDEGYLAKPEFRTLTYANDSGPDVSLTEEGPKGVEYSAEMVQALAEDANRNLCVINEVRTLIDQGHKRIIVFSASVKHAETLSAALAALEIDARVVTASTPTGERRRTIAAFRGAAGSMVLCNYGVLTTGFDAPNTSAAIIARPTKSLVLYSQMVGRAMRGPEAKGNDTCVISTVVDINLPGFGDMAEAFTNWEDVWRDE